MKDFIMYEDVEMLLMSSPCPGPSFYIKTAVGFSFFDEALTLVPLHVQSYLRSNVMGPPPTPCSPPPQLVGLLCEAEKKR